MNQSILKPIVNLIYYCILFGCKLANKYVLLNLYLKISVFPIEVIAKHRLQFYVDKLADSCKGSKC